MADKSPKAAGRGNSKGRCSSTPKAPDEETLAKVLSDTKSPKPDNEQFADTPKMESNSTETGVTTTGDGHTQALTGDLVKAKPSVECPDPTKLPPFSGTILNGPSSSLPHQGAVLPVVSKHIPSSTSSTTSHTSLNVNAPVFVPGSSAVLPADPLADTETSTSELPMLEQEALPFDSVLNLISGFQHVGEAENLHQDPLIKAATNMLLDGIQCILAYEKIRSDILTATTEVTPTSLVLTNLAEMLIHWGVYEEYFRPTACRVWQVVNDVFSEFRNNAMRRLMVWYSKVQSENDVIEVLSFALFFSELFSRIRLNKEPVEVLAGPVVTLITKLIAFETDKAVIGACNILKLTRTTFSGIKSTEAQVANIMDKLNTLVSCPSLSKSCIELITRVIEMEARQWKDDVGMAQLTPAQPNLLPPPSGKAEKGKLNADAPAFVPSSMPSNPYLVQQPVRDISEWSEFETDYNDPDSANVSPANDDYDGMDPEIELEMEAFISEIEEHLLNQVYDHEQENT